MCNFDAYFDCRRTFGGDRADSLSEKAGITDAATCALKAVGLGYIFGFTAETCASLGEPMLSSMVTLAGRVQIFLLAYPYFEKIINLGLDLLE